MESETTDTSASQTFLIDSKPGEDGTIVTEKALSDTSSTNEDRDRDGDGDGDSTMSRNSGTPAGSRSPKKNRDSQTFRSSEENVLRTLQDRIAELQDEKKQLKKELDGQKEYRLLLEETVDARQKEIELVEAKSQKTLQAAEKKAKKKADDLKTTLALSQQEFERGTEKLRKDLREANSRLKRKDEELKKQQEREQKVSTQLTSAQDHIFRMQPRRSLITETEAQEEFVALYNLVHQWVSNRLLKILDELDDGHLRDRPCPAEPAKRLLSYTQLRAQQDFGSERTDEYHVIAVIMQYLHRHIFNQDFYCPLDPPTKTTASTDCEDQTLATILRITKAMAKTDRDHAACRDWRFEALTALVSQPEFKERRANIDRARTEELLQMLCILIPGDEDPQELRESIGRNIVRPALDLAHRLQIATNLYTVQWTHFNNDVKSGPVDEGRMDFSHYICVNLLEGGKPVKVVPPEPDQEPLRITYLFDICPGLYCQPLEDGMLAHHSKVIAKPTILVAASRGERKLPNPGPTIFQWLEHGVTNPVQVAPEPPPKKTPKPKSSKWGVGGLLKAHRSEKS